MTRRGTCCHDPSSPELVGLEDLREYDLDSNLVGTSGGANYGERLIHGAIYRLRPDVHVDTLAPSLVPFGVTGTALRPVFRGAAFVRDRVPVFDTRRAAGVNDMLIKDPPLGRALAEALGRNDVVPLPPSEIPAEWREDPNMVDRIELRRTRAWRWAHDLRITVAE